MRFVLANRLLDRPGGTEVHLATVGEWLQKLGHEVWLYSPVPGPFSDAARARGLTFAAEERELPEACDVVLAQDTIVSHDLAARYPGAVAAFRICGDVFDFQLPPQEPGLVDLVVVLSERYERLAAGCAVRPPVLRLRVPVDLERLVPLGSSRASPRRAVLLGNYPQRTEVVQEACARRGIEVVRVGVDRQSLDVSRALAGADIVFAKSRAALDAMACGRAVYVYDLFGGDGWVTPSSYPALEADNFAGLASERVLGVEEIARDLGDYDEAMGPANRDLVVQHHHPRDHVLALLAALEDLAPAERPVAPSRELSRLVALNWSWQQTADNQRFHESTLWEQVAAANDRAADAERSARLAAEEAAGLRAEIEEMRATRAWRLAGRLWQLKARVRGPRRGG